jgi:hypothetical protein
MLSAPQIGPTLEWIKKLLKKPRSPPRILWIESEEKQANGKMPEIDTNVTHNTLRSEEEMQTEKQDDQQPVREPFIYFSVLGIQVDSSDS